MILGKRPIEELGSSSKRQRIASPSLYSISSSSIIQNLPTFPREKVLSCLHSYLSNIIGELDADISMQAARKSYQERRQITKKLEAVQQKRRMDLHGLRDEEIQQLSLEGFNQLVEMMQRNESVLVDKLEEAKEGNLSVIDVLHSKTVVAVPKKSLGAKSVYWKKLIEQVKDDVNEEVARIQNVHENGVEMESTKNLIIGAFYVL